MKILYLDCSMGASGDMLMGALFSLLQEDQKEDFLRRMNTLQLPGVTISAESTENGGIAGTKMHVMIHGVEEGEASAGHGHPHHADTHGHDHSHADGHRHNHHHAGADDHADTHKHDHDHADGHRHDHHHAGADDHGYADTHDHDHSHADGHRHNHHHAGADDHDHADTHGHDHSHADGHRHNHHHAGAGDHDHADTHGHDHSHADGHRHNHHHAGAGDHDHADTHGHDHSHADGHRHDHHHADADDHGHAGTHEHDHGHVHTHTSMREIGAVTGSLDLPYTVRESILDAFSRVAQAESLAHGKPVDQIHFHEVGQMDAIADVTGVSLLMEMLKPDRVVVSPVHVGSGTVLCAHGEMPVPAPATAAILRGVPVYSDGLKGELCTPTGAALLKTFADHFTEMPAMTVETVGYGLGSRKFEGRANCLRAFWGEMPEDVDGNVLIAAQGSENEGKAALEDRARDAVNQLVDSLEMQLSELDRASLLFNPGVLSEMEHPYLNFDFDSGESMEEGRYSNPAPETQSKMASLHSEDEETNRAGDPARVPLRRPDSGSGEILPETAAIQDPGAGTMIAKIECNIDDMTPEALAYAKEILLREGARDVYSTAVHMKKNRDGVLLSVICDEADVERMSGLLFRHTTTIGVRIQRMERRILTRRIQNVSTPYGLISVKIAEGFGVRRMKPESDEVARAASEADVSYEEVFLAAMMAAEQLFS